MESNHLVILSTAGKFIKKFNVSRCISFMKHYFGQGPGANTNHLKVTPTIFWLKCKNLPKYTKFCSAHKLEVAATNFDLLQKIVSCNGKYGG